MNGLRYSLIWMGVILLAALVAACAAPQTLPAATDRTLRVVMDNNYPPYIFTDAEGNLQGILVDEWALWEQKTGVKVEITALPWGQALAAMQRGEYDVIDTIFFTEERARFFDFTQPYADINVGIFFQRNISGLAQLSDLKGFRVAVKTGDANADRLLAEGVTDLVYYDSYEDIVRAAANHEEVTFVIDEPPGQYYLYKFGLQNEFNYVESSYGGQFHRAVIKGDAETLNLVSEGFSQITPAEYQKINERWFGKNNYAGMSKYAPFLWGTLAAGAIILFILFAFTQTLRLQVQRRTRELLQAMDELQRSEARFREVIDFMPIPIAISNSTGELEMINRKFIEHYGYTLEDIPTINDWTRQAYPDPQYRAEVLEIWEEDVKNAIENNTSSTLREYRVTCKDGSQRDVEITMHPTNGYWIASFNNVTNRKRTEAALRENELIFSSFLENSPVYVFFKDKNIRSLRLSRNYEKMLGMPIEEALGKTMDDLFPSELAKSMVADDMRILNEGKRVESIEELNGHIYETTKFPIFIDGKPEMLAGFTMDVTDRKRAEEALHKSQEQLHAKNDLLRSILESPKGIIIFSLDTRYCYTAFTVSHREIMKGIWNVDIAPGMCMLDAITNEADREKARSNFDRALAGEHFILTEEYGDAALRRSVWEDHYSPIVNAEGQVVGLTVFVIDISERVQAIAALQDSESRLRTVTENAPDTILQIDQEGIIRFINRTVPGLTRDEVLGTTVYRWVPEEQHPILERTLKTVFSTGERQEYESLGPGPHGEYRSYSVRVMPVLIEDRAESAIYIATDITERKNAEGALRDSEENYRNLVELSPDAIIVHSQGQIIFANTASVRLVGAQTVADIIGKPAMSFVHPDSHAEVTMRIQKMISQGERVPPLEEKFLRLNGNPVDVEVAAMPVTFEGKPAIQVIARDITERKKMVDELRASENRFRILFEHAGMGVAQINSITGRFVRVNQKYCDIVGYAQDEMREMNFQRLTYPEDLQPDLDNMQRLRDGEISEFQMEKRLIRKDGSLVWVVLVVSPMWLPGEAPSTHIAVVHEITEQKRAEYALRYSEAEVRKLNAELENRVAERTAQLESTNRELEAFAYSVSHDLRAPLRAIDGFSRIFMDGYANQLDEEGQTLINRVRQANQNMTQLVDALLGLSRMSRAELHHGTVDLSALAQAIIEEWQGHSPGRTVDWQVQEGLSAEGDARLLRVVLENLLGNALKFTAQQENSTITFGMKEFDGDKAYFVRDNGAGFDMKYAGKLFGAFQRLHSAAEFEGTGIGLATVQRIIHRHSGRVWAESEVGKGATFYFTLGKPPA